MTIFKVNTILWLLVAGALGIFSNLAYAQDMPNSFSISKNLGIGGIDSYTFSGVVGQTVSIGVGEIDTALAPAFQVYDSAGALVVSRSNNVAAMDLEVELPSTGQFRVDVFEVGLNNAGFYEFHFHKAPGADEGGTLAAADFVRGTLTKGDIDAYNFPASAGQSVSISMGEVVGSTGIGPSWVLFDPDGAAVIRRSNNVAAVEFEQPLTITGQYTLVVADINGNDTGEYELNIARSPGANELGVLSPGVSVNESLTVGDIDSFTFVGLANSAISFAMAETANSTDIGPLVQIFRPGGSSLLRRSGNVSASANNVVLPDTGTYTVIAGDINSDDAGAYTLIFQGIQPPPPPPPPKPILISPSGTAGLLPVYQWYALSSATWYQLWVENEASAEHGNSGTVHRKWYTAAQLGCSSGSGVCQVNAPKNIGGSNVRWWVQPWNSVAGSGSWSSPLSYDSGFGPNPPATDLISPNGVGVGNSLTYSWESRSTATYYNLYIQDSSGVSQPRLALWLTAAQAGCSGGGTCSYTPSISVTGGSTWWIMTYGQDSGVDLYGSWSAPQYFTP